MDKKKDNSEEEKSDLLETKSRMKTQGISEGISKVKGVKAYSLLRISIAFLMIGIISLICVWLFTWQQHHQTNYLMKNLSSIINNNAVLTADEQKQIDQLLSRDNLQALNFIAIFYSPKSDEVHFTTDIDQAKYIYPKHPFIDDQKTLNGHRLNANWFVQYQYNNQLTYTYFIPFICFLAFALFASVWAIQNTTGFKSFKLLSKKVFVALISTFVFSILIGAFSLETEGFAMTIGITITYFLYSAPVFIIGGAPLSLLIDKITTLRVFKTKTTLFATKFCLYGTAGLVTAFTFEMILTLAESKLYTVADELPFFMINGLVASLIYFLISLVFEKKGSSIVS